MYTSCAIRNEVGASNVKRSQHAPPCASARHTTEAMAAWMPLAATSASLPSSRAETAPTGRRFPEARTPHEVGSVAVIEVVVDQRDRELRTITTSRLERTESVTTAVNSGWLSIKRIRTMPAAAEQNSAPE